MSISLSIGIIWIGNNFSFLPLEASTNAPIYDELFLVLFLIGTILFIGMFAFIIYSLIEFRRLPDEKGDGIALEGNITLEIFWTAVPAIVILFVGLYSYDIYDRMGGMQPLSHGNHNNSEIMKSERIWGGIGSGTVESTNQLGIDSIPIEVSAMQFAFIFH